MIERDTDPKAEMPDRGRKDSGRTAKVASLGCQTIAACSEKAEEPTMMDMEEVVSRENMVRAYHRVLRNHGAAGVDGITVEDLWGQVQARWGVIRDQLLNGRYVPQPVLRVEIPKPSGKDKRMLGIPTVMDRLIQQSLLQVLQPQFAQAQH